jgi:predicted metal-dependent hydrolase
MMQTSLHEAAVARLELMSTKAPKAVTASSAALKLPEEEPKASRSAATPTRARRPRGQRVLAGWSAEELESRRADLQSRLAAYLVHGRPRVILTDNLRTMLSIKKGQGVYTFRIHHMFTAAPPVILRSLARYAERHDAEAAALLRAFIDGNEHMIRAAKQPRQVDLDTEGAHHNLQEIFDELNERYFDGRIEAMITWGPRAKRRRGRSSIKLGSYAVEDKLIRIHPVLDAADVPRFFVAWIVYHEMLHEVHDMPIVDGRRIYHTAEFRRAEARFDDYFESVLWERTNLHKLLDR